MSIQIIIGILINTMAFGIMGFSNNKLGIPVPVVFKNSVLSITRQVISPIMLIGCAESARMNLQFGIVVGRKLNVPNTRTMIF